MTPVAKWVKKLAQKWLGEFYEGEEPPDRLGEQVLTFANLRPLATRGEWIDFSRAFAEECYRAGYLRGVEHAERDPLDPAEKSPEQLADEIDPNWRWRPMIQPIHANDEIVPAVRAEHETIQAHLDLEARQRRKDRRF